MQKESSCLFAMGFLAGALLSCGFYLVASHFFPSIALLFLVFTAIFGVLGCIKFLNRIASKLPISLSRVVCWVHSIVFEAFALGFSFCIRSIGFMSIDSGDRGSKNGCPILLIHGYLYDSSAWTFLRHFLCRKGFGPVYTLNLVHPFWSISEYAELVFQKAAEIATNTGRNDLILIGHSMGGLVSAWYAAKVAPPGKVSDVITIGSPLGGTWAASMAVGPNGRDMRRGSDFVKALQKEMRDNEQIRFYHIASKVDQLILPYSSALTGLHPEREFLVEDIGHMTLLFSPRIAAKIEGWLLESV
jgi:pimeloyl-ACP methyl ester carboxylesterase